MRSACRYSLYRLGIIRNNFTTIISKQKIMQKFEQNRIFYNSLFIPLSLNIRYMLRFR